MEDRAVQLPREPSGSAETPAPAGLLRGRRLRPWERPLEKGLEALIRICGVSAILFVFGIFFFVFREGAGILTRLDLIEFLFSTEWYPTSHSNVRYGVLALIVGTLSVTTLAMAIAVPFGLGGAVFVSEFTSGRIRETLKIVIELLAAIPAVVWGFIGLSVMNPLIQELFHVPVGLNRKVPLFSMK
jgi:phosphate transport system permease protein